MDIKKLGFYCGLICIILFVPTGYYMLAAIIIFLPDVAFFRSAIRPEATPAMLIGLVNIMAFRCGYARISRNLEPASRILLLVAVVAAVVGFFSQQGGSAASLAVGTAFLGGILFVINEFMAGRGGKRWWRI